MEVDIRVKIVEIKSLELLIREHLRSLPLLNDIREIIVSYYHLVSIDSVTFLRESERSLDVFIYRSENEIYKAELSTKERYVEDVDGLIKYSFINERNMMYKIVSHLVRKGDHKYLIGILIKSGDSNFKLFEIDEQATELASFNLPCSEKMKTLVRSSNSQVEKLEFIVHGWYLYISYTVGNFCEIYYYYLNRSPHHLLNQPKLTLSIECDGAQFIQAELDQLPFVTFRVENVFKFYELKMNLANLVSSCKVGDGGSYNGSKFLSLSPFFNKLISIDEKDGCVKINRIKNIKNNKKIECETVIKKIVNWE